MPNSLELQPIGIGSLLFDNADDAMNLVKRDFSKIPFLPQLTKINKKEDMKFQFLEGMPSFYANDFENFVLDIHASRFLCDLKTFNEDYEQIVSNPCSEFLDKYKISENFCLALPPFLKYVKDTRPEYAKAQVVGAFTLSDDLKDKDGNYLIFNPQAVEIITKLLSLKALWLIRQIKNASPDTKAIIFIDEPQIAQLGKPAYAAISAQTALSLIKRLTSFIKSNGALSGLHCCGKCDLGILLNSGADIINFDAFSFDWDFSKYKDEINKFLSSGGKIAWGLVPTSSGKIIKTLKTEDLVQKFKNCVNELTKNAIDEKLVIRNSLITSSCGAGSLGANEAQTAMDMLKDLSDRLKEEYIF